MTLSARLLRSILTAYFLALAGITVVYGWHNARAANDWAIGEWLINYSAGFVRRGLPGEVVLLLSHLTSARVIPLVLALQLVVFGIFFTGVFQLTRRVRWSLPIVAILLSPATLAFHVLDPPAGFRKEILLFAGIASLAAALVSRRWKLWQLSIILATTVEICVLSHEPLALYLPYLFGAVFLGLDSLRQALRVCAGPAILAAVTLFVCARHPGTPAMASTICASVGGTLSLENYGVCGGAILYLSHSLDYARDETRASIVGYHYFRLYGLTGALALLPFGLLGLVRSRPASGTPRLARSYKILLLTFLSSGVLSTMLFLVATDWGRWIYIHVVCLMLLTLLIEQRPIGASDVDEPTLDGIRLTPASACAAVMVLFYATLWTLPHVGMFQGRYGYPSLISYLRHYSGRPHSAN